MKSIVLSFFITRDFDQIYSILIFVKCSNKVFLGDKLQFWTYESDVTCVCMFPWSTKAVISSTGIFVAISNDTLYGSKL